MPFCVNLILAPSLKFFTPPGVSTQLTVDISENQVVFHTQNSDISIIILEITGIFSSQPQSLLEALPGPGLLVLCV